MCKKTNYNTPNVRIDKCLRHLIKYIRPETCGSCCGHGKYHLTILVKDDYGNIWDIVSDTIIPRTRRFYKKDKNNFYFIPEVEDYYKGKIK